MSEEIRGNTGELHPTAVMANPEALLLVVATVTLMAAAGVRSAPAERDFLEPPDPLPVLLRPERSRGVDRSHYLKRWLASVKAAGVDGMAKSDPAAATMTDKQAQMMEMISALEELHRTFDNTLKARLTFLPRANGRNSAKKSKMSSGTEGEVTTSPQLVDSTASSANSVNMAGRNLRKSPPPPNKKTNKRVCFWKYCSQN